MFPKFISSLLIISCLSVKAAFAQAEDGEKGTLYMGIGSPAANVQHHFAKGQIVVLEVAAAAPLKSVSMLSAPGIISLRRAGVDLVRMEYEMPEDGNLEFRFEPLMDGTNNVVNYSITALPAAQAAATASAQ